MKAFSVLLFALALMASMLLHDAIPLIVAGGLWLAGAWVCDLVTAKARRERCRRLRAELGVGPSGLA